MSRGINDSKKATPELSRTSKPVFYGGVGITKTHLTPCRRIGLSRKFKSTPTNNLSPSVSAGQSTTPLPSTPLLTVQSPSLPSAPLTTVIVKEKLIDSPVLAVIEESPETRATPASSRSNRQSHFAKEAQKQEKINYDSSKEESEKLPNLKESKGKSRKSKPKKVNQKENKSNCTGEIACINLNSKTDEEIEKSNFQDKSKTIKIDSVLCNVNTTSNVGKKKFKRCLSMKKSSESEDDLRDVDILNSPNSNVSSFLVGDSTQECVVSLKSITEVVDDDDEEIVTAPSKKRCIMYSSDEEDFVPSQNSGKKQTISRDASSDEDWEAKTNELRKRIKQKEAHLANLRQAALYRKLHNVQEISESVKMWKKCCEDGLTYLLPKLQQHGQMDMLTLMKNVSVPESVVYDANTNSFV